MKSTHIKTVTSTLAQSQLAVMKHEYNLLSFAVTIFPRIEAPGLY